MLNRRHLRVKVLQALYAWYKSGNLELTKGEKELLFSIEKVYDLYLYLLQTLGEVRNYAEYRLDENKKKQLPSEEDLNPNTKFINNQVILQLANNEELLKLSESKKINWAGQRDDIFKKIYEEMRESELFSAYMADEEQSFKKDKIFATEIFKEFICNSELIHHFIEEISIFWHDDLDLVCGAVLKTIKKASADKPQFDLLPLYKDLKEDKKFVKELYRKTIVNDKETIGLIGGKAHNWELDRVAVMDMVLMKMAINEAKEFKEIPTKVTMNEYIEISKFYSTPKSNGFINGILDKVFFDLKESGEIKKLGRGLIE